jgi:arsenate reductase-like glutaredoxin family protein
MAEYNPEPMSDDELDNILDEVMDTPLADLAQRAKDLYKRLRGELAEDETPDTFKRYIKDELELGE